MLALLVAVLAGAGLGTYFVTDGRAREGKSPKGKGAPAVPVTVATVQQQTVPVRLHAIGNVDPFSFIYTAAASRSDRV